MKNTKVCPVVRYHVVAGGRTTTEVHEFIVIVKEDGRGVPGSDFMTAMGYVFDRFKVKTSDDLPKPFNMTRIDNEDEYSRVKEVVFAEKKKRKVDHRAS